MTNKGRFLYLKNVVGIFLLGVMGGPLAQAQTESAIFYQQELFKVSLDIDLKTAQAAARAADSLLKTLSGSETIRNLAKSYGVTLSKDQSIIEQPYQSMRMKTELMAILNGKGEIEALALGSRAISQMEFFKTGSEPSLKEKIDRVVLPLDLINNRSRVEILVGVGGISRSLLKLRDVKIDPKEGGTFILGLMNSVAFGGLNEVQIEIRRNKMDAGSGFFVVGMVPQQTSWDEGESWYQVDQIRSTSGGDGKHSRLVAIAITGGLLATRMALVSGSLNSERIFEILPSEEVQLLSNSAHELRTLVKKVVAQPQVELVKNTGVNLRVIIQ
ncbi:MAG: hypothetical protein NZ480_03620 [Bdellovibrionaceae bacterium]|nr:hypothetical protein [Pseudobdellovibrionaceae bacterium]MDW8189476.1 hypothetical protein [Pseudobdellovibrionaceae bacterium]